MVGAIVLVFVLIAFVLWACCANAGRISRIEEEHDFEEWLKERKKK